MRPKEPESTPRAPAGEACLTPQQVAAYLEASVTGAERLMTEAHLTSCDDCRECVVATADALDDLAAEVSTTTAPVPSAVPRRNLWPLAALATAAAVTGIVVVGPADLAESLRPAPDAGSLAQAVGPRRPTEGRLVGFAHGPLPQTRSGSAASSSPQVAIVTARIEKAAARQRDARTLTALGAARLVTGQVDDALAALREAQALAPQDAEAAIDLSAALVEKSRRVPDSVAGSFLAQALDAATGATRLAPASAEGWFNRALAEELAGRPEAESSWQRYLEVEADPAWSAEGRTHLEVLRKRR